MVNLDQWWERPLDRRAPRGGEIGCDGRLRRGGEFEPFYVPRPVMPQIDEADLPDLIRFATARGVVVRLVRREPGEVKHHQRVRAGFDPSKMDPESYAKPILTSADCFVLDGNHRLEAHDRKVDGTDTIELSLGFEEAIGFLFSFPKTYAYGDGGAHPESH